MDNFNLKDYLKNNPLLTEGIDLPSTYGPERDKEYQKVLQRQIQDYIEGGSRGDLDLRNTPITSLPDGLGVGGVLELSNTPINILPNNLKVGWGLFLRNTPLSKKYTKEEIRKMIEDKGGYVKGSIYL